LEPLLVSDTAMAVNKPPISQNTPSMDGHHGVHDIRKALIGVARTSPSRTAAARMKKTDDL
jgi:hypothetical protein